jgi:hypothetical protein
MSVPGPELARSIVSSLTPEGSLRGSSLPIEAFDPEGVSAWLRSVVGDAELADLVSDSTLRDENSPHGRAAALQAERFGVDRGL